MTNKSAKCTYFCGNASDFLEKMFDIQFISVHSAYIIYNIQFTIYFMIDDKIRVKKCEK